MDQAMVDILERMNEYEVALESKKLSQRSTRKSNSRRYEKKGDREGWRDKEKAQ